MTAEEGDDCCKQEQRAAQEQEQSERWIAKFKDPIILFTGALAVFAFFQTIAIFLQYCVLKSTERVFVETMESKRPWIGFTEKSFSVRNPFGVSDDGAYLTVKIDEVRNGGDTAARGVHVAFSKMIVGPIPTTADEIRTILGHACDAEAIAEKYENGELVLPNQEIPLGEIYFFAPASELPEGRGTIWITGCIGYMDAVKKPRWTSFAYSVNGLKVQRIPGLSSGAH